MPKPAPGSEFVDKLRVALEQTAYELRYGSLTDTALADFVDSLVEGVVAVAGMMVLYGALAVTQPHLAVAITAAGYGFAGAAAVGFITDLFRFGHDLSNIESCDRLSLQARGNEFARTVYDAGIDIASGALLGAFGGVASIARQVDTPPRTIAGERRDELQDDVGRQYDEAVARTEDNVSRPTRGQCSFAGDTLVRTSSGYRAIRDIEPGADTVWARDERTGRAGWRDVLARYSNRYDDTVRVTAREADGDRQTIVSNRIHPVFARIAAGALAGGGGGVIASEGHVYAGDIAGGAWVDAQHLTPGDQLFGEDGSWQTVESVSVESVALEAFNLTVEGYSTYFVAGSQHAAAVWVHNTCHDALPDGYVATGRNTDSGQPIYAGPSPEDTHLYRGDDGKYHELDAERISPVGSSTGPVPGRVQSRVNVTRDGFRHTVEGHLSDNPKPSKSQFDMTETELRRLLQSPEVVRQPARLYRTSQDPRRSEIRPHRHLLSAYRKVVRKSRENAYYDHHGND